MSKCWDYIVIHNSTLLSPRSQSPQPRPSAAVLAVEAMASIGVRDGIGKADISVPTIHHLKKASSKLRGVWSLLTICRLEID